MSITYAQVREVVVEGVIRRSANPPTLDRIRMIFDAAFLSVNSQTAEAFAARNDKRELLRVVETITFTAGSAPLSVDVLKKFMGDATLVTSDPLAHYAFRKYPDYIRGSSDPRLGIWTSIGESVLATTPATIGSGAIPLVGTATFSSIQSPPEPATESAVFVASDDYITEFSDAMIQFIEGQSIQDATEAT